MNTKLFAGILIGMILFFSTATLLKPDDPPQKKQKREPTKVDSTELMRKQKTLNTTMDKQLILWDSLLLDKKRKLDTIN